VQVKKTHKLITAKEMHCASGCANDFENRRIWTKSDR